MYMYKVTNFQNTCITSQIENRAISVNFQQKPLKLGRLIILQVHTTNLRPAFNTIFTHLYVDLSRPKISQKNHPWLIQSYDPSTS